MTSGNVIEVDFAPPEKIYVSDDIKIIDITTTFFAAAMAYFKRPKRANVGRLFYTRAFFQHREIIWSDFSLTETGRSRQIIQSKVIP